MPRRAIGFGIGRPRGVTGDFSTEVTFSAWFERHTPATDLMASVKVESLPLAAAMALWHLQLEPSRSDGRTTLPRECPAFALRDRRRRATRRAAER